MKTYNKILEFLDSGNIRKRIENNENNNFCLLRTKTGLELVKVDHIGWPEDPKWPDEIREKFRDLSDTIDELFSSKDKLERSADDLGFRISYMVGYKEYQESAEPYKKKYQKFQDLIEQHKSLIKELYNDTYKIPRLELVDNTESQKYFLVALKRGSSEDEMCITWKIGFNNWIYDEEVIGTSKLCQVDGSEINKEIEKGDEKCKSE